MPHIHTAPGQHDATVSAYIVRKVDGDWRCLVHFHKKLAKLMQIGGHIELTENPWSALAHELVEETGYNVSDLKVLQPYKDIPDIRTNIIHPLPAFFNTHKFSEAHFHSDLCYAFLAEKAPTLLPQEGESTDLRWLTLEEIKNEVEAKNAYVDLLLLYQKIIDELLLTWYAVKTDQFSTTFM